MIMKHLMSCASLALFLCSCATVSSKPEELQRTWDAAHVQVLHNDIYVFGRLSAPINQQKLAKLPSDLRFPTVIYLHGCAGLDWGNISNTTGALIKQGFALIAPDSFALSNRTQTCGMGMRGTFQIRAAEAQYAAARARDLPWVDADNLFLIGHSEGGAGVAAYGGTQFNALVISGFACNDGIWSGLPTLAVAAKQDRLINPTREVCPTAQERMLIPGTQHYVLRNSDVSDRVVKFLTKYLKR